MSFVLSDDYADQYYDLMDKNGVEPEYDVEVLIKINGLTKTIKINHKPFFDETQEYIINHIDDTLSEPIYHALKQLIEK